MSPDGSTRDPDDALERLTRDAAPGEFSFFGRTKGQQAPPPAGIQAGRVIGDFKLIAPIGQGGMGQVWEAEQVSLKRRVALKLVRPDRVNEHTLDLFSREARAGGRLSHPGIVGVHGHGEAEGVAWISMELVEGAWTLKDFIEETARKGELPGGYHKRVAELVAALADALQAAHEANVIHRDLKPANVLITPDEQPKVTDFGLAKITDETALSVTGDFAGTYAYMSPEQAMAKRMGIDHRTDVFSLGIVLYELLALRRPFEGDTAAQVAEQIVTEEPLDLRRVRSRIPADLAVIAGKCLEKSRGRRYQTMADVAADIRRHLASEPILAKTPSVVQRAAKWVRRHPTQSAVGAVVAAALSVISILLVENIEARETLAEERTQLAEEVESVGRLSDRKDLDDLLAEVDRLWPAYPANIEKYEDWIRNAEGLVARLPLHRQTLAQLQAQALPQTPEERSADRASHPLHEELVQVDAEWQSKQAALQLRLERAPLDPPAAEELDWSRYPGTWEGLLEVAGPLVEPHRILFGREQLGLWLCQRALGLVQSSEAEARVQLDLARAHFALGRDDLAAEAIHECSLALEGRSDTGLDEIETLVEAAGTESARLAAQAEVDALGARHRDLDALVSARRRTWRFPSELPRADWWNSQLTTLIESLEALADPDQDLLGEGVGIPYGWGMRRRLANARLCRAGFAEGGEFDRRWNEVLPAVRLEYPELELSIQMGLVPIGTDPQSGLREFWHLASGSEPVRREDGRLLITADSGLVLVLLHEGSFFMGSQSRSPNGPNYDPVYRGATESPVHRVTISPFFLSKYEMTSAQWKRVSGMNRSAYGVAGDFAMLPVDQVRWLDCVEILPRFGLTLPSEAQWEYATRAGTTTPWWVGSDERDLIGAANLMDRSAAKLDFWFFVGHEEWLEDGYTESAPVDAFLPNGFGLFNVHGNLWEWCLDDGGGTYYSQSPVRDPLAQGTGNRYRVVRGGSWYHGAVEARSARRGSVVPEMSSFWLGLRPARAITK